MVFLNSLSETQIPTTTQTPPTQTQNLMAFSPKRSHSIASNFPFTCSLEPSTRLGLGPTQPGPDEPVQDSEKTVSWAEKEESQIFLQVPDENKGSDNGDGESDGDAEGEADGGGNGGEGEGEEKTETEDAEFMVEDEEQNFVKTWNLRPRKQVTKGSTSGAAGAGIGGGNGKKTAAVRRRGNGNGNGSGNGKGKAKAKAKGTAKVRAEEREKRMVLSISLTKEEIEEDFLRMTGEKPPKKPMKRPKNVQKQMDVSFPGLWLTTVTPAMYQVPDPPLKG